MQVASLTRADDERAGSERYALASIRCVNPIDTDGWDEALVQLEQATIFHSSAWARVLHRSFGYRPMYVSAHLEKQLVAVLPLMEIGGRVNGARGVSLPLTDFCGPLGYDEEILDALYAEALRLSLTHRWRSMEFRGTSHAVSIAERLARLAARKEAVAEFASYFEHTFDFVPDAGGLFSRIRPPVLQSVRRARTAGLGITVDATVDSVRAFERLHASSRRGRGLFPQSSSFYHHLHRELLAPGQGFVVTAWLGRKAVSSAVFMHFGGHAVMKYLASEPNSGDDSAGDLVLWEGICQCARDGVRRLSLGRTPAEDEAQRSHRTAWGTDEWEHRYARVDARGGRAGSSEHDGLVCAAPIRMMQTRPRPAGRLARGMLDHHLS